MKGRRFVWDPKKQKVVEVKEPKRPRNRGIVNHVSDGAAVHPDDAQAATAHAAANGHGNITYNSEGQAVMRNGSHRQWRRYLKTIGLHDKGSYA